MLRQARCISCQLDGHCRRIWRILLTPQTSTGALIEGRRAPQVQHLGSLLFLVCVTLWLQLSPELDSLHCSFFFAEAACPPLPPTIVPSIHIKDVESGAHKSTDWSISLSFLSFAFPPGFGYPSACSNHSRFLYSMLSQYDHQVPLPWSEPGGFGNCTNFFHNRLSWVELYGGGCTYRYMRRRLTKSSYAEPTVATVAMNVLCMPAGGVLSPLPRYSLHNPRFSFSTLWLGSSMACQNKVPEHLVPIAPLTYPLVPSSVVVVLVEDASEEWVRGEREETDTHGVGRNTIPLSQKAGGQGVGGIVDSPSHAPPPPEAFDPPFDPNDNTDGLGYRRRYPPCGIYWGDLSIRKSSRRTPFARKRVPLRSELSPVTISHLLGGDGSVVSSGTPSWNGDLTSGRDGEEAPTNRKGGQPSDGLEARLLLGGDRSWRTGIFDGSRGSPTSLGDGGAVLRNKRKNPTPEGTGGDQNQKANADDEAVLRAEASALVMLLTQNQRARLESLLGIDRDDVDHGEAGSEKYMHIAPETLAFVIRYLARKNQIMRAILEEREARRLPSESKSEISSVNTDTDHSTVSSSSAEGLTYLAPLPIVNDFQAHVFLCTVACGLASGDTLATLQQLIKLNQAVMVAQFADTFDSSEGVAEEKDILEKAMSGHDNRPASPVDTTEGYATVPAKGGVLGVIGGQPPSPASKSPLVLQPMISNLIFDHLTVVNKHGDIQRVQVDNTLDVIPTTADCVGGQPTGMFYLTGALRLWRGFRSYLPPVTRREVNMPWDTSYPYRLEATPSCARRMRQLRACIRSGSKGGDGEPDNPDEDDETDFGGVGGVPRGNGTQYSSNPETFSQRPPYIPPQSILSLYSTSNIFNLNASAVNGIYVDLDPGEECAHLITDDDRDDYVDFLSALANITAHARGGALLNFFVGVSAPILSLVPKTTTATTDAEGNHTKNSNNNNTTNYNYTITPSLWTSHTTDREKALAEIKWRTEIALKPILLGTKNAKGWGSEGAVANDESFSIADTEDDGEKVAVAGTAVHKSYLNQVFAGSLPRRDTESAENNAEKESRRTEEIKGSRIVHAGLGEGKHGVKQLREPKKQKKVYFIPQAVAVDTANVMRYEAKAKTDERTKPTMHSSRLMPTEEVGSNLEEEISREEVPRSTATNDLKYDPVAHFEEIIGNITEAVGPTPRQCLVSYNGSSVVYASSAPPLHSVWGMPQTEKERASTSSSISGRIKTPRKSLVEIPRECLTKPRTIIGVSSWVGTQVLAGPLKQRTAGHASSSFYQRSEDDNSKTSPFNKSTTEANVGSNKVDPSSPPPSQSPHAVGMASEAVDDFPVINFGDFFKALHRQNVCNIFIDARDTVHPLGNLPGGYMLSKAFLRFVQDLQIFCGLPFV